MGREKQEMTRKVHPRTALSREWVPGSTTDWRRRFGILCLQLCLLWPATAMASPAQDDQASKNSVTLTTLFSFDGTNGDGATGSLVQGMGTSTGQRLLLGQTAAARSTKSRPLAR